MVGQGRGSMARKPKAGWVYFIRCTVNGLVKIGHTASNPDERFKRLNSISAVMLEPVALMRGTVKDERALHARFIESVSHGEWFEVTPELEAVIIAAEPWHIPKLAFKRRAVAKVRISSWDWAEATMLTARGVTKSAQDWCCQNGLIPYRVMLEVNAGVAPEDIPGFLNNFVDDPEQRQRELVERDISEQERRGRDIVATAEIVRAERLARGDTREQPKWYREMISPA
jgi:hypothetical protein